MRDSKPYGGYQWRRWQRRAADIGVAWGKTYRAREAALANSNG